MNIYSIDTGIKCVLIYKLLNTSEWTQNSKYRSSKSVLHLAPIRGQSRRKAVQFVLGFSIHNHCTEVHGLSQPGWRPNDSHAPAPQHQPRYVSVHVNKAVTRKRAICVVNLTFLTAYKAG